MSEERNVEGMIVGVDGGQWTTTALIQTDDGTQVEASVSDIDLELVGPGRFREGTRIQLDVPARFTAVRAEHLQSETPSFYEVSARRPFSVPRQAEWIDGAGQAHPLCVMWAIRPRTSIRDGTRWKAIRSMRTLKDPTATA